MIMVVAVLSGTAETRKPNVVIIYTDDQPMDSFGFIRGKAHTPNIDRLAKEGAYFSKAYATSSVCSPSRYSALTGQYASRCQSPEFRREISEEGVTKVLWNMGMSEDQWNFPRVMQANGYKTGMIGKWHVGSSGKHGHRKTVPNNDPKNPEVKKVLQYNQEYYCKDIAEFGFDYVGAAFHGNPNDDPNLVKTGCNVHLPEWQTKHALEFIETYKDEPFVLYYASTLLHVPDCTADLKKDPRLTPLGWMDEPIAPGVLPPREDVLRRAREAGVPDSQNGKLIAATWLDDVVGAVQDKLMALGLDDNTLILYFNDNSTDDQGKGSCYQGGAHVPMMAYLPGVVEPGERKELVANIDIAPTIFDYCGVTPPEEMQLDGASLMPLCRNETVEWRDSMFLEIGITRAVVSDDGFKYLAFRVPESYTNRPKEEIQQEHREALANIHKTFPWTQDLWHEEEHPRYMHMGMAPGGHHMERFQLYLNHPPFEKNYFDPDQLYDLNRDPRETTNLASNPEYQAKLERMQKKLKKLLADVPGTFADLKPTE
ncbi:Arylsulfatase [Pontiella desulfatans]|uniref:Arylsulfatase n=2 Tax=Pontiella desulfatans TaxID=2750659 RepID=A0A6C2UEH6_PONDE|nr:sulfatase S1_51 [Kiritimatiellales bacterium]VGO17774.1 Arylsulfatase [Pontiella desulfatans]